MEFWSEHVRQQRYILLYDRHFSGKMEMKNITCLVGLIAIILLSASGVYAVAPPDAPPLITSTPVVQGVVTAQETISLYGLQGGPLYFNPFLIMGIILIIVAVGGIFYIRNKKRTDSGYKPRSERLQK
jgi:hypothetical protein